MKDPERATTNEMARGLAERLHLQHATVMDLLQHGWTYTSTLTGASVWTDASATLQAPVARRDGSVGPDEGVSSS